MRFLQSFTAYFLHLLYFILIVLFSGAGLAGISILFFILFLIYPFYSYIFARRYPYRELASTHFFTRTDDGWNLEGHIFEPENPDPSKLPVIIVHGIASNYTFMNIEEKFSIARYLQKKGYRVFSFSLRGSGSSFHNSGKKNRNFYFDDIINHDIPAILGAVSSRTGKAQVNWVAHSMGGIIMYAYLAKAHSSDREKIQSLAVFGSPGTFEHLNKPYIVLILKYLPVLNKMDFPFLSKLILPLACEFNNPIEEYIYNPEVTDRKVFKKVLYYTSENIADGLAYQLLSWSIKKKFTTIDDSYVYSNHYGNIHCPALFFAGEKDYIAPPSSVKYVFDRVHSVHKEFHLLSKENSFGDYGHNCLITGEKVGEDIYPVLGRFLEEHGKEKRHLKKKQRRIY